MFSAPGQDLKKEIQKLVTEKQIKAGWLSTGVGSLTNYNISAQWQLGKRPLRNCKPHRNRFGEWPTPPHQHKRQHRRSFNGWLRCLYHRRDVILSSNEFVFKREKVETTGWQELQIIPNKD